MLRVTTVAGEKQLNITYSECASAAFAIQHAKRMRRIILSLVACLALPNFFHILAYTIRFSGKKKTYWTYNVCFDFLYNNV